MGGRLSMPRSADAISEIPKSASADANKRFPRGRGIINGRTVMAPLAAFTMACLLFVYSRTSIRAAKLNAQKRREADGGQISWRNESLRRHGQMDNIKETTFQEALVHEVKLQKLKRKPGEGDGKEAGKAERSAEEEKLRKMMGKDD